ncbi:MAG: type II toxin-antitoxin system VapC family toxin [Acidimicrobiales bacterium]
MLMLDTHVLIWWVEGGTMLSSRARSAIAGSDSVLVSPISFWEVATLVEKGRIRLDRKPLRWVDDLIVSGVQVAALTASAAVVAAQLEGFHGDPADRFLYATARELGVPFVTKDQRIRSYAKRHKDVTVVW